MSEQVLDMSGGGFAEPSGCSHSVRISFVLHGPGSDDGIVAAAPQDLRFGGIVRCLQRKMCVPWFIVLLRLGAFSKQSWEMDEFSLFDSQLRCL